MGEPEPEDAFKLLCDDYARQILAHLSNQPMVAEEIGEKCEGSDSTVYDRLDQLHSLGLVSEELQIDPQGHHRKRYETILNSVHITFTEGRYEIQLEIEEDAPDRFAGMWGRMRRD
ncbi:ArsR family transcriptional regulator [Halalkaliarchaeum desulfuricum]|uniref:ArsR family transcriptional regulator n=1 Tax=Halalkaliarchaeum desulfuricum TaxID=2055893 RepID=A0A343TK93_9EURY|nr:winged helix-turn-helix domain-containing protein [Halalkaliarchaeum desulfuricum]AUX09515.1 ArsR family transcriptional regulator [Halalkaliarchaeum desulfuricum]